MSNTQAIRLHRNKFLMAFRSTFSGTLLAILLIWGPIDHSWPAWLVIRLAYLILLPLASWWILKWIWNYFQPTAKTEVLLERVLSGIICLILWTLAVLAATAKIHFENTQWIQTHEGMEAVGDDIIVKGPDLQGAFIIAAVALLFLWFGVIKKESAS
jgi:hypothetical protein